MQNQTSDRNQLTDKELHYVKDFLSWELLAMKKYNFVANACMDPQIKNTLQQKGQQHRQHYELLLSQLQ